jgi:hypothetical protein
MVKLTVLSVKDKGIYYFSKDRLIAVAKEKNKFKLKKFNEKNSFLAGVFFMECFEPSWIGLYGSETPIDFNFDLKCSIKE